MNAEITYCYNYWQMYKNPCEIAARKKRLRSKVVVPKKKFSLRVTAFSRREQFFSGYSVSLFHKSSCGHPSLNEYGFFKKSTCSHELRICNVFDRYLKGIELISNSSCSHPFDECPVFFYKKTIAATDCLNLLCFCKTRVVARRYHR